MTFNLNLFQLRILARSIGSVTTWQAQLSLRVWVDVGEFAFAIEARVKLENNNDLETV